MSNQAASINPPSLHSMNAAAPTWYREQVVYPTPFFPALPNVGKQFRRYRANLTNEAANTELTRRIQLDIPCVVYALTGACFSTNDTAFPVGSGPLDQFLVRFENAAGGDRLDTAEGIASALLGSAERPALIGGCGWQYDRGGTLIVGITPLRANLRIDVYAWVIELRGPTNIGSLG